MAQFDVHRAPSGHGYLLDCQSDLLDDFGSRLVTPLLLPSGQQIVPRLHPKFRIDETEFIMSTHLIFAIPNERMGPIISSLAKERYIILNAIDMLLTGV